MIAAGIENGMLAKTISVCIVTGLLLITGFTVCSAQVPVFSAGGPDAELYGAAEHFPVGSRETAFDKKCMVGTFSHFDTLYPAHTVSAASHAWNFQRPATAQEIHYFHAGSRYTVKDYLAHLPITGLLIAKGDQILFEGYQYDRTDHDRFTSQSMVKTIVSTLAGIAASEHAIGSTADIASKYIPELKNSDYGKVTVRNLLHMASGVTCHTEDPSLGGIGPAGLAHDCKEDVPGGTRFRYSAADSEVLGLIVERAVHMPLARYLQERIWQNIGTESKATWTVDGSGRELAFCCFNATLRDYARFARLLAYDGAWNGKQLIPRQWLLDATTIADSDPELAPGKPAPFFGYGYQVWIFPGPRRMFALLGANGQRIFVDPQTKLIMVQTAVMERAVDPSKDREMIALWLSLVHYYKSE
jgi:CubicO group peptidase (beta-lactamase class C family)